MVHSSIASAERAKQAFSAGPLSNQQILNLCGPLDRNLRQIELALDVKIKRRGDQFEITGVPTNAALGSQVLMRLSQELNDDLEIDTVQLAITQAQGFRSSDLPAQGSDESPALQTRRADLQGRTPTQREYLRNIQAHDITFGIGPAGTGKTYLAVASAVDALERESVKRLILTRPAVEAGERLGFLPGDLAQKVDPYLRPLYDALYDLLGVERTAKLFERQVIEVAPLAYMRGRTLNHSFVILDEAQNTTPEQMKMFLTRIGFGSKAVVTGDVTQMDLPKNTRSGLVDAQDVLRSVKGISFTRFNSSDVVRHPLVAKIVDAYDRRSFESPRS